MMNAGFPANAVSPPSSHGAGKLSDIAFGSWLQSAVTTVANPRGTEAAWSKVMFSGIYRITYQNIGVGTDGRSHLRGDLCWNNAILLEGRERVARISLEDAMH